MPRVTQHIKQSQDLNSVLLLSHCLPGQVSWEGKRVAEGLRSLEGERSRSSTQKGSSRSTRDGVSEGPGLSAKTSPWKCPWWSNTGQSGAGSKKTFPKLAP